MDSFLNLIIVAMWLTCYINFWESSPEWSVVLEYKSTSLSNPWMNPDIKSVLSLFIFVILQLPSSLITLQKLNIKCVLTLQNGFPIEPSDTATRGNGSPPLNIDVTCALITLCWSKIILNFRCRKGASNVSVYWRTPINTSVTQAKHFSQSDERSRPVSQSERVNFFEIPGDDEYNGSS